MLSLALFDSPTISPPLTVITPLIASCTLGEPEIAAVIVASMLLCASSEEENGQRAVVAVPRAYNVTR